MDLDIQPLDILPIGTVAPLEDKLDIQALDIQPLDTPKEAPKKERTAGEMSIGALEAGASMFAGLPSMIGGGLAGLGKLTSGQGIDAAAKANEDFQESNFGMGKFKAKSEAGQAYTDKLGAIMKKPVEWAGDAGEAVGGNLGRANAEVAVGTLMNFLPIPLGMKGMKGSRGRFDPRSEKMKSTNKADKLESLLDAKDAKATMEGTVVGDQLDLLPRVEIKGTSADLGPQFDPTAPMPEVRGGLANKRQMGFEFGEGLPDRVNVDRVGEAVRSDVNPNDLAGREAITKRVSDDLDIQAREQRINEQEPRVSDDSRGQADLLEENNPTPYTPAETQWSVDENGMPVRQDLSVDMQLEQNSGQLDMFDTPLTKGIDDLYNSPLGKEARVNAASRIPVPEPTKAAVREREAVAQQMQQIDEYVPGTSSFNARSRRQGGGLFIGGNKRNALDQMNKVSGLRRSLSNFLPDALTNEEFVERHGATADVQQNAVQKIFNYGTKGGDYMVEKTGNPLIKRVVDEFKGADGRAKAAIQTIVHENYAAKLRSLSKDEFVESWQALKAMEARGAKLAPEELVEMGYNQKQRDLITTHQQIMDSMVPKWEQAMSDAGMGSFKPEVAYVASKATGQFRKVIYKKGADGELSAAGVIGADTRSGLNKQVAAYQKLHPEYEAGPEQTFMGAGKGRMADGFEEMLHMLSNSDPTVAEFVARSKEMMNTEVQNYRGAKSHTMLKKGVEGMDGNKPWEDAYTNAKEGFDAQVAYLNRGLEFAEKAAAVNRVQPLLAPESGLKMPNATSYAKDYMDMALGRNPMQVGRAVDDMFGAMGKASGIGTAIGSKIMSGAKQVVNTKLLALNPLFLMANAVEIFRSTPEMSAYLRQRGVDTGVTGLRYNAEALMDMAKEQAGQKLSPVIEGALKYANDNHVYASDLFDKSNETRRGKFEGVVESLQKPAAFLEHHTRKNAFLGFTRMLKDNGITPKDGLYEAATKLTDMAMNSYSKMESPMGLQNAGGGISSSAYNLMSYKFNQLSRFAMMARDVKNKGSFTPVLTSLAMQVAFGGLMGVIGYKEADLAVQWLSQAFGKPTSLTKLLLESDKKVDVPLVGKVGTPDFAYGGFGALGGDMTNRLGSGYVTGDLSKPLDIAMPGASALVDAGASALDFAKEPNKFNAMKAAVDILPGGSLLDRHFFSKTLPDGTELASSRRKEGEATAKRNDTDKMWKNFGGTGTNEAKQKTLLYENQRIDKIYKDKQDNAVALMAKEMYASGEIKKSTIDAFSKAQGNADSLNAILETMKLNQVIDAPTRDKIKAANENTVGGARKMQRRFQ